MYGLGLKATNEDVSPRIWGLLEASLATPHVNLGKVAAALQLLAKPEA